MCDRSFETPFGLEPTEICNTCAQGFYDDNKATLDQTQRELVEAREELANMKRDYTHKANLLAVRLALKDYFELIEPHLAVLACSEKDKLIISNARRLKDLTDDQALNQKPL